jgi:two-component system chemotaxis response regulator CheY
MEPRPRILIVDDDRFVRVTLRDCLAFSEFEVLDAEDGEEALEAIEKSQPQLVFLDLVMPRLSGLDVLRQLRARGVQTRILVISSMDVDALVREAMAAGADGFISKPFHPLEISSAVRRGLRLNLGEG